MLFPHRRHVALDWNPGQGYNTLLLGLIPGNLYTCIDVVHIRIYRQFQTLTGLLHSGVALPNLYHNFCREAVCTNSMMVFGITRPGCGPTTQRVSIYLNTDVQHLIEEINDPRRGYNIWSWRRSRYETRPLIVNVAWHSGFLVFTFIQSTDHVQTSEDEWAPG